MADRYSFQNPFASRGQPWFEIGGIGFTTTVTIIAANVTTMIIWAFEGAGHPITNKLVFITGEEFGERGVLGGEIWRIFTWPLYTVPTSIWAIIGLAVFYMLGGQLEGLMGRRAYLSFIILLTVVPALVVTGIDLLFESFSGSVSDFGVLNLGILVAFAAQYPAARFFFGIPAPVLVGVFVGLQYLQIFGFRDEFAFVFLTTMLLTALVGLKSLGYASDVSWIPALPLPKVMTGQSKPRSTAGPKRRRRRRTKSQDVRPTHLAAVPSEEDILADMELNTLLDQIAADGLDSLTKQQRKRLDALSKRRRQR